MLFALLLAQATPVACPAVPVPLPAEYVGWTAGGAVAAGARAADAPTLVAGRGVRVTLAAGDALASPVAMTKTVAHGGLVGFDVGSAGRYRVAMSAALWADVIANHAAIGSVGHGHGPDCSAVKKYVEWELKPGRYLLQLTGEPASAQVEMVKIG